MLANMVCSLIKHRRITTTLKKAKVARSVAEKMVTLGKSASLHDRRLASARLFQDEEAVKILFTEIAPAQKERRGGYTRVVRLGQRPGDAAEMAILEFVDYTAPVTPEPLKAPAPAQTAPEPVAKTESAPVKEEAKSATAGA
jgi:large subunit ribosomal protein L17